MKLRKSLVAVGASILMFGAMAAPTLAGNSGDGSEYGTQPGFAVSQSHTICSGHGAFGYFGKDNSLQGGANGTQTGINNSSLCGNAQN
jgi:hypothetical protein